MINLLPPENKQAVRYSRMNVRLVKYVFAVIFSSVIASSVLVAGGQLLDDTEQEIRERIASDEVRVASLSTYNDQAKELSGTINQIARIFEDEVRFSQLLREVGSVIPEGVILSSLQLSESREDPLSLQLGATSADKIAVALENIEASDLFVGGEVIFVQRTGDSGDRYEFSGQINTYFVNDSAVEPVPAEEEES